MLLIFSVIALVAFFLANVVFGMKFKFGFRNYWFFELEHFLGGFFVAMFLSNFFDTPAMIFIGLAIVTFIWETIEYSIAQFNRTASYMQKMFKIKNVAPGWKDTLLDTFLNFLGAAVFIYIIDNNI